MLNLVLKILGLEFLHGNHILHRDLKLSNVMLKSDGHIVIVDLGLLKVFGDTLESEKERPGATKEIGEPRATSRCGTVCYMAPEVLNREEYDLRLTGGLLEFAFMPCCKATYVCSCRIQSVLIKSSNRFLGMTQI
jgi:serine/threonine protein kinase